MFNKIKKFFNMGLWTVDMVRTAVTKGVITGDEYKEIMLENITKEGEQ